jgi:hypothetical protein
MIRATKVAVLLVLLIALPVHAGRGGHGGGRGGGHGHGGGWHGHGHHGHGHHGHGHFHGSFWGPSVAIGGYWDPFWPRYYPYPYYYPYPAPYPYPVYPPPAETDDRYAREEERQRPRSGSSEERTRPASYGLIQVRGVPDGAQIDLDDEFWLEARDLDNAWMAISEGRHSITVRVDGNEPVKREVEMRAGAKQIVKFGPFRKR